MATFTDRPNIEALGSIDFRVHETSMDAQIAATRLLVALKRAVARFNKTYSLYRAMPANCPDWNWYYEGGWTLGEEAGAKYIIEYDSPVDDRRVFRALVFAENEKGRGESISIPIAVKFQEATHRGFKEESKYPVHVVRAAHDAGLAPRLLSVQERWGWRMIVMQDLTPSSRVETSADAKTYVRLDEFLEDVRRNSRDLDLGPLKALFHERLDLLHRQRFVHGDIEPINTMAGVENYQSPNATVTDVKVIDWDWAGGEGKVTYPPGDQLRICKAA